MSRDMNKVPPDGGYGWVVTFAYALNNVVVLPLIAGFGLIFQEAFDETGLNATEGTLIIVLNHGIGMLLSFFGGPLLNRFGYRKVAVTGALLVSSGLILTALSNNFWLFLISYSIINAMGVASVMAAFSLAINSFFKQKRGRAVGLGMSITGLGTIYTPLLMSFLMNTYGWRYAVLILGAICLHSLLASLLLRPAKWYLIDPPKTEETIPLNQDRSDIELVNGASILSSKKETNSSVNTIELVEKNSKQLKSFSTRSLNDANGIQIRSTISHPDISQNTKEPILTQSTYKWWESQEINLGSSVNIFKEDHDAIKEKGNDNKKEEKSNIFKKIVEFFDLTLLKDPIFVNILLGLSLASCVETNFSLLLPIILKDMLKFETFEIAKIMAVIGFSDTLSRVFSAFIGDWCHRPPRFMYIMCLLIIIIIRTIMMFTTSFIGMVFVALLIGLTKGVRTVFMNIIVPNHVPLERLAFASGIQMLCNGIVITTIGSLLGRIRDYSGSYKMPIVILNAVTFVTIILWSAELFYFKIKKEERTPKA